MCHAASDRHHQRPEVPHGLRGWAGEPFGAIGDTRLTVMAALTIADEFAEISGRLHRLEEEIAALQDARVAAAEHAKAMQAAVAAALNSAAERIETLSKRLNQTLGDGGVAMG